MEITGTSIDGVYVIAPEPVRDERGWFARIVDRDLFNQHGLVSAFIQQSISFNERRGTLRGLHWQASPHEEVKLIRCTAGAIHDVVVDLRSGSPTFERHFAIELTAENHLLLYIPEGCAHGFLTLQDATEIHYEISESYHEELARGVRWDDPRLSIRWPFEPVVISARDASFPHLG